MMGIDRPDHQILGARGYFTLYLTGLLQGKGDGSERRREYEEVIRMLAAVGPEQVRDILERHVETQPKVKTKVVAPPVATRRPHAVIAQRKGAPSGSSREIRVVKPTPEQVQHLKGLAHARTREEALTLVAHHMARGELHDAYHIMVDYLLHHPLSEESFQAATNIILRASAFNREKGIPPENMLFECEEMAAVLLRRIPDMSKLGESEDDDMTTRLYHFVRQVYQTWTTHCHALLEYKYRASRDEWVRRNWIDPQEFGFLVEVMRMGIRSRLPLDLLRFIFREIHRCIGIGINVIASDEKKAKFEGDCLRFIASPTKDVIPDLQLMIYRRIVHCYMTEGDFQNAQIFCKQCLMIARNDREMLEIKKRLEEGGSRARQ